jgi:predicted nucleic acid-binding protein
VNVIDSSAWLEYFADGPNARHFAKPIETPEELLVPSITLFEVFKRVCQQRDESAALQCIAVMQQSRIVDLDSAGAILWTQDADFEGLPGVRFWRRT